MCAEFKKYLDNTSLGITKDKFLAMRQQWIELGQPPQPMSDCPAALEDFPSLVLTSLDIFSNLADIYIPRMEGNPYFQGKDRSGLDLLFRLHFITSPEEQLIVLNLINILEARAKKDLNKFKK